MSSIRKRLLTAKKNEPKEYEYKLITDSWEQIIANIDNGKYKKRYTVGNYKPLDLGSQGVINMQIVAMDADEKSDRMGTAAITLVAEKPLASKYYMNPAYQQGVEGTGSLGGWGKSQLRTWLKSNIKPLIPEQVRNRIVEVDKYTRIIDTSNTAVNNVITADDVWIPSYREVGQSGAETLGVVYNKAFSDVNIRRGMGYWWLRTAYAYPNFRMVNGYGSYSFYHSDVSYGIMLAFCLD